MKPVKRAAGTPTMEAVDQRPEVTVVVPHYGEPAGTVALVDQLRVQEGLAGLEIVVVDDASPTPFPALPGVVVVRRERNGGFGAAVNSGAEHASGHLLVILNSDVSIARGALAAWVRASRPWMPAVTGPLVMRADGEQEWTGARDPRVSQQVIEWFTPLARWRDRDALRWLVGREPGCVHGVVRPVDWLSGAALLVPREAFRAIGGFDEEYFMYCEEVDLQQRLREVGVIAVFIGSVTVTHVGGGSTDPERRQEWLISARMRQAHLRGDERRLRAGLAAASLVNFVWNAGRALLGRETRPRETLRRELWLTRIPRRGNT